MKLQSIKIPAGWLVNYNQWYEVDPQEGQENYFIGSSLLMMENLDIQCVIDLSLRPEGDIKGCFQLQVLPAFPQFNRKENNLRLNPDWDQPYLQFSSKNRLEILEKIESLLGSLSPFEDPRILISPGVVDDSAEKLRLEAEENGLNLALEKATVEHPNPSMQLWLIQHPEVSKESLKTLIEGGRNKKIRNMARHRFTKLKLPFLIL